MLWFSTSKVSLQRGSNRVGGSHFPCIYATQDKPYKTMYYIDIPVGLLVSQWLWHAIELSTTAPITREVSQHSSNKNQMAMLLMKASSMCLFLTAALYSSNASPPGIHVHIIHVLKVYLHYFTCSWLYKCPLLYKPMSLCQLSSH